MSNIVNFGQGGAEGIILAIFSIIAIIGALLLAISIGDIILNDKPANMDLMTVGAVMMAVGLFVAGAMSSKKR